MIDFFWPPSEMLLPFALQFVKLWVNKPSVFTTSLQKQVICCSHCKFIYAQMAIIVLFNANNMYSSELNLCLGYVFLFMRFAIQAPYTMHITKKHPKNRKVRFFKTLIMCYSNWFYDTQKTCNESFNNDG